MLHFPNIETIESGPAILKINNILRIHACVDFLHEIGLSEFF
jgi:hypothetical protein